MKFCKIQYNYTLYYKYYINEHYCSLLRKALIFVSLYQVMKHKWKLVSEESVKPN